MNKKLVKTLLTERIKSESKMLGLICLGILLLAFLNPHEAFYANGELVFQQGQYWRAFSSALMHADFNHLASNSFFFTGLAILLNNYFGFLIFPLISLLMGGVINLIVLKFYPPAVFLVGISGVVYFMAAFWLTLYLFIERRMTFPRRLIIALGLTLIFLAPQAVLEERVSYLAHGVGFVLGILCGLIYYAFKKKVIKSYDVWQEMTPDIDLEAMHEMAMLMDRSQFFDEPEQRP